MRLSNQLKGNITAVLLGITFSFFLVVAIELFFRLDQRIHLLPPIETLKARFSEPKQIQPPELSEEMKSLLSGISKEEIMAIPDPFAVLRNIQEPQTTKEASDNGATQMFSDRSTSERHHMVLEPSGKTLFSVLYNRDRYGAREVIGNPTKHDRGAVFIGCSFTFGDGLEAANTLPSFFAKQMKRTFAYNWGKPGGSPNETLNMLQSQTASIADSLKDPRVIIIYRFFSEHPRRTFCPASSFKPNNIWIAQKPIFEERLDHKLHSLGTCENAFPIRNFFYRLIGNSAFYDYFKLEFPPNYSSDQYEYFVRLLEEIRSEVQKKAKVDRFIVLFEQDEPRDKEKLIPYLLKHDFQVADFSALNIPLFTDNANSIPFDAHPSPRTNFFIARLLAKYLSDYDQTDIEK